MPIIFGYKNIFFTTLTAILVMSGFFVADTALANTVNIAPNVIGNYNDWNQFGGSGATLDLQKIDAVSVNNQDLSYIYQGSNGQIQTFGIPNNSIPAGSLVNSVTVTVIAKGVGGGDGNKAFKILLEQGLNQTDNGSGLSIYPTSSYQSYNRVMASNPLTGLAWTASQINSSAVNFGVLRTNASGVIRISQIFVTIDYTPTTLVVTKIVINHGATKSVFDFQLFIDSTVVISGVENILDVGSYIVSEANDPNYNSTISGDCDALGNINLVAGDSKQCIVVNEEKLAYLTIHKNVISHINNLGVSDFAPYKVSGNTINLDVATVFDSGSYSVTENSNSNYIATFIGDCDSLGALVLNSGDNKTCTITNEDGHLPYANNLSFSNSRCSGVAGSGVVNFSWYYQQFNGKNQSKFRFQIATSTDPNFSSPIIDRTFDNLSNPPNWQNQQSVMLNLSSVNDTILYGVSYIWRVKVWDSDNNSSDWVLGLPYQNTGHPDPYVDFSFSPLNPNAQTITSFTNNSVCYNSSGFVACQSYAWSFGDGNTSSIYNPTNIYGAQGNFTITLKTYDEVGFCETNQLISVNSAINYHLPVWKEISPFVTLPPACFSAKTKVLTPSGSQAIENLRVGDKVLSYDLESSQTITTKISKVFVHNNRKILQVLLSNGNLLKVTPEHPFYNYESRQWVNIGDMIVGQKVMVVDSKGNNLPVSIVSMKPESQAITVYNLEVDNPVHNYMVEGGILVHNKFIPI